jgi:hypothetical protein
VERFKLKDNHTWKSKPGYSICVIDRGVARFDYPSHWIVEPGDGAVHLHDQPPSVESCDLGVSLLRFPMEHVQDLPLDQTLRESLDRDRQPYQQSEIQHITRPDLEICWLEQRYREQEQKRDARFRVALARGTALCLISMNYWADRAVSLEPVWDEVLRTLVMGVDVADPIAGPMVQ